MQHPGLSPGPTNRRSPAATRIGSVSKVEKPAGIFSLVEQGKLEQQETGVES